MRAIDRIIDCFMHGPTDCPLIHLGSSLLNMHYSELTTNGQHQSRSECQQEYNSRMWAASRSQTQFSEETNSCCDKNSGFRLAVEVTVPIKVFIPMSLSRSSTPIPVLLISECLHLLYRFFNASGLLQSKRRIEIGFFKSDERVWPASWRSIKSSPKPQKEKPQHSCLLFPLSGNRIQVKRLRRALYTKKIAERPHTYFDLCRLSASRWELGLQHSTRPYLSLNFPWFLLLVCNYRMQFGVFF